MYELIEQHYRDNSEKLMNVVRRRVGDNHHVAQEAVQEAYCRALKYHNTCHLEDSIDTWFNAILNNVCRDIHKEELRNGGTESLDEDMHEDINVDDMHLDMDININIKQVTNDKHRKILEMFFNKSLRVSEICKVLDRTTVQVVKNVIYRFRDDMIQLYA